MSGTADVSSALGPDALRVVRVPGRQEVTCALGIDPGGTSGLFLAAWNAGERQPYLTRAWQCGMAATPELLDQVLTEYGHLIGAVQIEEFDARERSRKMRGFRPGAIPALNATLAGQCAAAGIGVRIRPPATAKDWATDKRLRDGGLYQVTTGKPHARDASRHALYTAVRDLGVRDPLSRKASA